MTMVDALLSAAHSEDSEYFEEEVPQISSPPLRSSAPQIRVCEFCNSSNTPTWRRGPGGKGSLCNACGIKWRLRKRTKKGDTSDKPKASKSPAKRQKRTNNKDLDYQPDYHMATLRNPIVFRENITADEPSSPTSLDSRKNYFCKFCNKTWDFNHFKNSQQFGAHCSNCSRRSSQDGMVPDGFSSPLSSPLSSPIKSPSSFVFSPPTPTTKRFPPPPFDDAHSNLMLILRLMQEEDDFSDYESEPQTPSTPPSPTSVVPISSLINPINVL